MSWERRPCAFGGSSGSRPNRWSGSINLWKKRPAPPWKHSRRALRETSCSWLATLRRRSNYISKRSDRFASRFNEAKSWLAKADALKLDSLLIRRERLIVAFATGDRDNVEKILKEEERGSYREDFLHEHSLIEIQEGRFHSAERLRLQALGRTSKASNADWWVVLSALEDAEVGKDVQARRYESKAAGSPLDRYNKIALALALARSGRSAEAGRPANTTNAES